MKIYMSLPAETQRTMESIYEDFQTFLSRADFSQAKECIKHMSDYSETAAKSMKKEFDQKNLLDLCLRIAIVNVIGFALIAVYLWRTA